MSKEIMVTNSYRLPLPKHEKLMRLAIHGGTNRGKLTQEVMERWIDRCTEDSAAKSIKPAKRGLTRSK